MMDSNSGISGLFLPRGFLPFCFTGVDSTEAAGIERSHTEGGILGEAGSDVNAGDAGRSGSLLGDEREEVVGIIALDETVVGTAWDTGGRRDFFSFLAF